jgi:transposase
MTSKGLLTARGDNDDPIAGEDTPDKEQLTCELIFEASRSDGDYHGSMNGDMYMKWIENRFFPTVRHLYPGKRIILVIDNASYHHARGAEYIRMSGKDIAGRKVNKAYFARKLREVGVKEFCVTREVKRRRKPRASSAPLVATVHVQPTATSDRSPLQECSPNSMNIPTFSEDAPRYEQKFFKACDFEKRAPAGPSVDELKARLRREIEARPEISRTRMEIAFEKASLADSKRKGYHFVIYTPPYESTFQPAELVWSYVKNYVSRHYGRAANSVKALRVLVQEGFNGGEINGRAHLPADSLCAKYIDHCWKAVDSAISRDAKLSGDKDNLKGVPNP